MYFFFCDKDLVTYIFIWNTRPLLLVLYKLKPSGLCNVNFAVEYVFHGEEMNNEIKN